MALDQIYYTHCTFRTSALAHGDGDRPYGYSPRASSLPGDRLQACCRNVLEPILSRRYRLPGDVPESVAAQLTAADAPVRLFFDATGKSPVLGAISYRPKDATGQRMGSYFAHFLVGQELLSEPGPAACRLLQLFAATGWQQADDPSLPQQLAPLDSIEDLLAGRRPAVDEQVVRSFLTSQPADEFDDPAAMISPEFRRQPAARAQRMLETLLAGLLAPPPASGRHVLLAAEPGMAALLFFAALRLLPAPLAAEYTSFSTFETDLDVLPAMLVAAKPSGDALAAPAAQAASFWFDPLAQAHAAGGAGHAPAEGRHGEPSRACERGAVSPPGAVRLAAPTGGSVYCRWIVRLLVEEGWPAVRQCLARMEHVPREQLDYHVRLEALAAGWLDTGGHRIATGLNLPAPGADAHRHLARALADRLHAPQRRGPDLASLAQLPAAELQTLFHSLAQSKPLYGLAGQLALRVEDALLLRLWTDTELLDTFRHELLRSFLKHAGAFPHLLIEAMQQRASADRSFWRLLAGVLLSLPAFKAKCVVDALPAGCQQPLLSPLLWACRRYPAACRLVEQIIDGWPVEQLLAAVAVHGQELAAYDRGQRLSRVARQLLRSLADPESADNFSRSLDALEHLAASVDRHLAAAIESWLEVRRRLDRLCGKTRNRLTAWLLGSGSASRTSAWLESLSKACDCLDRETPWTNRRRLAAALFQVVAGRPLPDDLLEIVEQQLFWPVWHSEAAGAEFECQQRLRVSLPHDAHEAPLLVFRRPAGLPPSIQAQVECRAAGTPWRRGGRSFAMPAGEGELSVGLDELKFLAADGPLLEIRLVFSAASWPAEIVSASFRPAGSRPLKENHRYGITLVSQNFAAATNHAAVH